MKFKDALSSGDFKKLLIKSYLPGTDEEYLYDKADIVEGKIVGGVENYSLNDDIITFQNDWSKPGTLIVFIRTIRTDKIYKNYVEEY